MASFAQIERSALYGIALPGRHGAATGMAGVLIEERSDIAFASVIAKRDKRFMLVNAVNTAFGVALPDGPRRAGKGAVAFAGTGPDQWIASAEGPDAAGFAARLRGRIGSVGGRVGSVRLAARVAPERARARAVLAKGLAVDLHPKVFRPGDVATTLVGVYRRPDRHARRRADLSAHRAAQHGGQFLVVALGIGRRIRL